MDPIFLFPFAVGAVALAVAVAMRAGTGPAWEAAAAELGLTYLPGSMLESPKIEGSIDDFPIKIDIVIKGAGKSRTQYTRFSLTGHRIPRDIAMASETFWSRLDLMGEEIEVGDEPFDEAVKVRGIEQTILAVLDHPTRMTLSTFVSMDRGHLQNSQLEATSHGRLRDTAKIVDRVTRMVDLAKRLSIRDDEILDRIALNVAKDPNPTVRHRNLRYLGVSHKKAPAMTSAARHALVDPSPQLRLLAGHLLGPEGLATLETLVADAGVPTNLRCQALKTVADRLPRTDAAKVLRDALRAPEVELARAAAEFAGVRQLSELAPTITELSSHDDVSLAAAAAAALGSVGTDGHAPHLVTLLDHDADEVCIGACESLARVGTIDSVEALAEHTKGVFKNGELKRAARAAIKRIQERAGGADAGRLSVLETEDEGALSVAGTAGAIAIVDDEST